MHLVGSDLDLDWLARGADHGGVQALIEVELRHCDVVLEPTDNWPPSTVNTAERRIAILHRRNDHTDGNEVEDLVELATFHDHLLVDAPEVFTAPRYFSINTQLGEAGTHLGHGLGQVHVALGCPVTDEIIEFGKSLRMQRSKGQVFELLLHLLHAEAVGQRCVDVDGLLRDAMLLLERHTGQCAHVVKTVSELDDEDPEVFGHRHEHLAHRGGLLLFAAVKTDAFELRDTVNDRSHVGAEIALDVSNRDLRVFDGIVEKRSDNRDFVETDVGDNLSDRQRMIDVALATPPSLRTVRRRSDPERTVDRRGRFPRMPTAIGGKKRREFDSGRRGLRATPGQNSIGRPHDQ